MAHSWVDVKYKNATLSYMGRNGTGQCKGVCVDVGDPVFTTIIPINSRGSLSKCFIEIPKEDVSEVCAALQSDLIGKILDQIPDRLPTLLGLDPSLDKLVEQRLKGV